MTFARALWQRLEPLHAVTYFADESIVAARDAGLKGFWMGYFGFRAAPMGPVGAATVHAVFANFAPAMIARAIPDAWRIAGPETLLVARCEAAVRALRRLTTDLEATADRINGLLERVSAAGSPLGRPLFAANARLELPPDPVARLWQLSTSLREHRGDGHVQVLSLAEVGGCEAHQLLAADHGTPPELLRDSRGWDAGDWHRAAVRLGERGLVVDGRLTPSGRELRAWIETETDRLAGRPFERALDDEERRVLLESLATPSRQIVSSGLIPFPNPIGLSPPTA